MYVTFGVGHIRLSLLAHKFFTNVLFPDWVAPLTINEVGCLKEYCSTSILVYFSNIFDEPIFCYIYSIELSSFVTMDREKITNPYRHLKKIMASLVVLSHFYHQKKFMIFIMET